MLSKARVLSIAVVAALACLAGCRDDSAPDARIAQPNIADAMVATPDAPISTADARPADARPIDGATGPDARPADARAADAPVQIDASAPDAADQPDAMEQQPDASPPTNPAKVMLNEVSPNGGTVDDQELIELWVTQAGNTQGIEIRQDYTGTRVLAVLPDLEVAENDLIVVHLQADPEVTVESSSKEECTSSLCYPLAFDVVGEAAGAANIGYSYRVLFVKGFDGTVTDAVPFMQQMDFAMKPAAFDDDLPLIIDDGHWLTECVAPCDYDNLQNMFDASVNWTGAGVPPAGDTTQRKGGGTRDFKVTDWSSIPVTHTMGEYNTTN